MREIVIAVFTIALLAGCVTPSSIMRDPMPPTFSDWCRIEMQEKRQVMVDGEVQSPGVLSIPPRSTLASCIAAVGGFTAYASSQNVCLVRGDMITEHDMRNTQGRDYAILPGDKILVHQCLMWGPNPRGSVDWLPQRWKKVQEYYDKRKPNN